METAKLTKNNQSPAVGKIGELILQNGRQAGSRRPLGVPTTFIGRAQGSDIRLNIDGVDTMHCVLIYGPDGLVVRDLHSKHGTFVNGDRISAMPIRHGDLLKVGPFQFRVDMAASAILDFQPSSKDPIQGGTQDGIRVLVASVAAQQIALEEEETRLLQRQSDLQQQEEQLSAHLAEKQRQVQMWSEHIKTERDSLRKQRNEQQQVFTQWEQELNEAKEHLGEEQQRLIQERQRINKVYQRLRQRWQRQWTGEKQKYHQIAAKLQAEARALETRQAALREQESALAQETLRFNTDRELSSRQLQENWDELKKGQVGWRRRQVHERALAKARLQELEQATARMHEARLLLQEERQTWEKQQVTLHKELHGLNNRVVHQRQAVKDQEEKLTTLDQELRTRLLHLQRVTEIEAGGKDAPSAAGSYAAAPQPLAEKEGERAQRDAMESLCQELTDQRLQLVEQYKRLAEIQECWSLQRDQAAQELEALAAKMHDQDQTLLLREHDTAATEKNLVQERTDVQALRKEIQNWRSRLRAREQAVEQDNQKHQQSLRQQEVLLQEQLSGLTYLRQRWNRRRQEEVEFLRGEQTKIKQQCDELHRLRQDLVTRGQTLEEAKRILTEKVLAVEQFRQELTGRSKDPAAERKIERLRRRWLMQNAGQIRLAKREREQVQAELAALETRLEEWATQMDQLSQSNAQVAEQQLALEERETLLKAREQQIEQEIMQAEAQRQLTEEKYLRIKDEVEQMAKAVYDDADPPAWPADRAA